MCARLSKEELEEWRKRNWDNPYYYYALRFGGPACYIQSRPWEEMKEILKGVMDMCILIMTNIHMEDYMDAEHPRVYIVPYVVPQEKIDQGLWAKETHIEKCGLCHISLHIDYDTFESADSAGKKRLYLENVFKSFKVIRKRMGRKFDCERLINDIKALLKDDDELQDVIA